MSERDYRLKKSKNKLITYLLSFAMLVSTGGFGMLPGGFLNAEIAYADDTSYDGTPSMVYNYVKNEGTEDESYSFSDVLNANSSHIWYGVSSVAGSNIKGTPRFRVLDPQAANTGAEGAVFVVSEDLWRDGWNYVYRDDGNHVNHVNHHWTASSARQTCLNLTNKHMTSKECDGLLDVKDYTDSSNDMKCVDLTLTFNNGGLGSNAGTRFGNDYEGNIESWPLGDEKCFLLSVDEVQKYIVGHEPLADDNRSYTYNGYSFTRNSTPFDFRFGYNNSYICFWTPSYDVNGRFVFLPSADGQYNFRPAFNLDLSKVLLATAAEYGKTSNAVGSEAMHYAVPCKDSEDWKVTLQDNDRDFEVTSVNINGNIVTAEYTGAIASDAGNEFVSAIMMDDSGDISFYGRVKKIDSDEDINGSVNVDLSDVAVRDGDTLYLYSEQYNGDYHTDYASDLVPVIGADEDCVSGEGLSVKDGVYNTHVLTKHEGTDPTCEESGSVDYWTCDRCGGYLKDKDGEGEYSEEEVAARAWERPALGHTYEKPLWTWQIDDNAPTGLTATALFTCKRCKTHTVSVDASGYKDGDSAVDPSITVEVSEDDNYVPATCTEYGSGGVMAEVSGLDPDKGFSRTTYRTSRSADLEPLGHDWADPDWVLVPDNSTETGYKAVVSFVCNRNAEHTETLETADLEKHELTNTCDTDGMIVYTAKVRLDGHTYSGTLIEDIEKSNHSFEESSYSWSGDGSLCIASKECSKCKTVYSESANITSEVTKEPTATEPGETTYTAAFTDTDFETQTLTLADIPAKGTGWGEPEWSWEKDGDSWKATATFTDNEDSSKTKPVEATVTKKDDGTYTATAELEGLTYTSSLAVAGPEESKWNDPVWSWEKDESSTSGWKATASFTSKDGAETEKVAGEISGEGPFKASATLDNQTYTSTLTVESSESDNWNAPEWNWTQDESEVGWAATATFTSKTEGTDPQTRNAVMSNDENGVVTGKVTFDEKEYSSSLATTTPKDSVWNEPTWKWEKDEDGYKATATFTSKEEGAAAQNVTADITKNDDGTYTAKAKSPDEVSTYSATLEIQDASESEWGEPEWNWEKDGDGYKATATFTSNSDPTKIRTVEADVSGENPYTATVRFGGEKYTTTFKVENSDDGSGNDPSWKWEKDSTASSGWNAVATFTDKDGITESVTATITGSNPLTATVEHNGRKYTSTLTIEQTSGGGGSVGGAGTGTKVDPEVEAVKEKIDALSAADKVTIEDKDAIEDARKAYDALTDEQKKEIDSVRYKKLTDVENAYAGAKDAADKEARENQTGEDGTALGRGASFEAAEKAILGMTSDADPAGSKLMPLKVKSVKQTKKSVKVQWSKPTGAVKYVVYGNKCGTKNKMKRLKITTKASINFKKIAGKKVKKGTSYKFIVVALDKDNNVVSTSKVVHAVTKGSKKGNPTKLTVKSPKSLKKTLTVGKSFTIKSKISKKKGTKTYLHVAKNYKGLRYESSNPAVAKVSKSGKVTAISAGTAKIIVYTQNGINKTVNVTVK